MPQFANHLNVVRHTFLQAFRLQLLPYLTQLVKSHKQVVLNFANGKFLCFLRGQKEVGRIDFVFVKHRHAHTRRGTHLLDAVNLVIPKAHANHLVGIRQIDVHRVAFHTEISRLRRHIVARVKGINQAAEQHLGRKHFAHLQLYHILVKSCGVAHTVNARDGRDYDDVIAPREQGRRSRQAEFINILIDSQVLLNIGIRCRNIRLGLVIIVVAHVILHRIIGEEPLKLRIELRRQRLVVTQHQDGLVHLRNNIRNRKGLTRPCHA